MVLCYAAAVYVPYFDNDGSDILFKLDPDDSYYAILSNCFFTSLVSSYGKIYVLFLPLEPWSGGNAVFFYFSLADAEIDALTVTLVSGTLGSIFESIMKFQ